MYEVKGGDLDLRLSVFTALSGTLFSRIIAKDEGSFVLCCFLFLLRKYQNKNPIMAIRTTPPTTTPAMMGILLVRDAVTLFDIGITVAVLLFEVIVAVGLEVGTFEVDTLEVDTIETLEVGTLEVETLGVDTINIGALEVGKLVDVILNWAGSKSPTGHPFGLQGSDLQHPWKEPLGVWSKQVHHSEVDGHFTLGSLVAAVPASGIPAAVRFTDGHPLFWHGLLRQQPWNVGTIV
jgi:hypothetical protein